MKKLFFSFILLLAAFIPMQSWAQIDPSALIQEVLQKNALVRSFEADVDIDVDVDFIRIPVKKGRIFYKAPDRFRFRATGFALVPKKGLNFSVMDMLGKNHTAIYAGEDALTYALKIVPMADVADFVIATVWIEKKMKRISRMQVTTNGQGNYSMEFSYGNLPFDLPVTTTVSFDIQQLDIPMKFIGNLKVDPKKAGEKTKGSVSLRYSNFRINEAIPDAVFLEN